MPRERGKIELSLFPFLNILFSLIGVLILYIFVILVMGRASGRASVQAGVVRGRAAARNETRELEAMRKKSQDLEAARQAKGRRLERLESERDQLAQILELRSRQVLSTAAGTSSLGVPIGAPVRKEWRMIKADKETGDNRKTPILVRIDFERFTVYDFDARGELTRKTEYPAIGAPRPSLPNGSDKRVTRSVGRSPESAPEPGPDPRFIAFLDGVKNAQRDRYVLFLVGPDGIEQFRRIMAFCAARYTTLFSQRVPRNPRPAEIFDIGYEPFSSDWLLIRRARDQTR
jgi:hypothetical protein